MITLHGQYAAWLELLALEFARIGEDNTKALCALFGFPALDEED